MPQDGQVRCAIRTQELEQILRLAADLLDIRVTFFDAQAREPGGLPVTRDLTAYCRARRRDREFRRRCIACDRRHLQFARARGGLHVYHCHHGLIEGVVPLYDDRGIYLGAIVFGQARDPGRPLPDLQGTWARRYRSLPVCSRARALRIGCLVEYLARHIIDRELVKYENRPWARKVEEYIDGHLHERIRLRDLADLVGRSVSFVAHRFREEFGHSMQEYIKRRRLRRARELLGAGTSVTRTAQMLGFYDAFHFSKVFRAHYGRPPRDFKRG